MYMPLSGSPPGEKETESTSSSTNQVSSEVPEESKQIEKPIDDAWQEVFDLAEIETVEEMNDLIYKVSSFLVQDRSMLSKWISGVQ